MANPSSESPTHPDAPRAGGETPLVPFDAETSEREDLIEYYRDQPQAAAAQHEQGLIPANPVPTSPAASEEIELTEDDLSVVEWGLKFAAGPMYVGSRAHNVVQKLSALRAALLAQHRDGERAPNYEAAVTAFRQRTAFWPPEWVHSNDHVEEAIDAAMCAPPSPERASK